MAPIHLERLLEIACSPAVESCPHVMKNTGSCTPLEELEEWGLIERMSPAQKALKDYDTHGWRVTSKGQIYLEAVLETPLPVQAWKVPLPTEERG